MDEEDGATGKWFGVERVRLRGRDPACFPALCARYGVTVDGCLQNALPVFEALTQYPARHLQAAFRRITGMMDQPGADSFPVEETTGDVFGVMERLLGGDVSRRVR